MRSILVIIVIASLLGCADRTAESKKEKTVSADEVFQNPVDQKVYVAPGGWKTYQPDVPRLDDPSKKVKTEQVRLLTAQADITARTTVKDLAELLKEAERLTEVSLGTSSTELKVMVQFKCTPKEHEVSLAHQGNASQEMLQAYYDALTVAKKLPVRSGEVSFQMELSVKPGAVSAESGPATKKDR